MMDVSDYRFWSEPYISNHNLSCPRPDEELQLIPPPQFLSRRTDFVRAGLSPNCRRAFLATKNKISLVALRKPIDETPVWTSAVVDNKPLGGIKDAALSDQCLVVLTSTGTGRGTRFGLELYKYSYRGGKKLIPIQSLECGSIDGWIPTCVSVHDGNDGGPSLRVVVGGHHLGPEIRLYELFSDRYSIASSSEDSSRREHQPQQHLRRVNTFKSGEIDKVKAVSLSQDGESIVAVSNCSRALIWHIRQTSASQGSASPIPIGILEDACNGPGMTSATVFQSPELRRSYAFCTIYRVSGSFQRSVLAPVARSSSSTQINAVKQFQYSIDSMSSEVVVGTVSEDGRYLATVERRGEIRVFQTFGYQTGGLGCEEIVSYQAASRLCLQDQVSPTSIRLRRQTGDSGEEQLQLIAIDLRGNLVIRTYNIV